MTGNEAVDQAIEGSQEIDELFEFNRRSALIVFVLRRYHASSSLITSSFCFTICTIYNILQLFLILLSFERSSIETLALYHVAGFDGIVWKRSRVKPLLCPRHDHRSGNFGGARSRCDSLIAFRDKFSTNANLLRDLALAVLLISALVIPSTFSSWVASNADMESLTDLQRTASALADRTPSSPLRLIDFLFYHVMS